MGKEGFPISIKRIENEPFIEIGKVARCLDTMSPGYYYVTEIEDNIATLVDFRLKSLGIVYDKVWLPIYLQKQFSLSSQPVLQICPPSPPN